MNWISERFYEMGDSWDSIISSNIAAILIFLAEIQWKCTPYFGKEQLQVYVMRAHDLNQNAGYLKSYYVNFPHREQNRVLNLCTFH